MGDGALPPLCIRVSELADAGVLGRDPVGVMGFMRSPLMTEGEASAVCVRGADRSGELVC